MVLLVGLGAIAETALLLGNTAHYSIDCYLSMIIVPLLISHPRFSRWARFLNPYIPNLTPEEDAKEIAMILEIESSRHDNVVSERMWSRSRHTPPVANYAVQQAEVEVSVSVVS